MAGLIDPAAELVRLDKRIKTTREELGRAQAMLTYDNFVRSAPDAVVTQERERLADFERALANLGRQIEQVRALVPAITP